MFTCAHRPKSLYWRELVFNRQRIHGLVVRWQLQASQCLYVLRVCWSKVTLSHSQTTQEVKEERKDEASGELTTDNRCGTCELTACARDVKEDMKPDSETK